MRALLGTNCPQQAHCNTQHSVLVYQRHCHKSCHFSRINFYVRPDGRSQLEPKHVAVNELISQCCVCVCVRARARVCDWLIQYIYLWNNSPPPPSKTACSLKWPEDQSVRQHPEPDDSTPQPHALLVNITLQLTPGSSKWSIPAKRIIPHVLPIVLTALTFPIIGSGNSSVFPKRPAWGSTLSWGHEWAELYVHSTIRPHSVYRDEFAFSSFFCLQEFGYGLSWLTHTICKQSVGADMEWADRTATVFMCCTVAYVNEMYTRPTECRRCVIDRRTDRQSGGRTDRRTETGGQTDRQTDRRTGRQTDRRTDRRIAVDNTAAHSTSSRPPSSSTALQLLLRVTW